MQSYTPVKDLLLSTLTGGAFAPVTLAIATDPTVFTIVTTALGGTVTTLAGLLWMERNKRGEVEREKAKVEVELAVANTKLLSFGKEAPDLVAEIAMLKEEMRRAVTFAHPREGEDRDRYEDRVSVWPYDRDRRPSAPRRGRP